MLRDLIPDPTLREAIRALDLRCAMTVPLTARGETFGALTLVGAETHHRYGRDDLRLAEEIADRAALAVDTARLFAAETAARAEALEQSRRNEILKDVTAAFGRAPTTASVMTAMLEQGILAVGARAGTVGLVAEGGRVDLIGISGYEVDDHPYWHSFDLADRLPMSEAIRERRPVIVSTGADLARRYPSLAGRGDPRDHVLVCLPLFLGDAAIGGFSASYPPGTTFSDDDLSFLVALGEQCAQAVDRARSNERERTTRASFDALAEASRRLARTLDLDETAITVVRLASEYLGATATLYVPDRGGLVATAAARKGVRVEPAEPRLDDRAGHRRSEPEARRRLGAGERRLLGRGARSPARHGGRDGGRSRRDGAGPELP
jgi:GAF domain-containing protein